MAIKDCLHGKSELRKIIFNYRSEELNDSLTRSVAARNNLKFILKISFEFASLRS